MLKLGKGPRKSAPKRRLFCLFVTMYLGNKNTHLTAQKENTPSAMSCVASHPHTNANCTHSTSSGLRSACNSVGFCPLHIHRQGKTMPNSSTKARQSHPSSNTFWNEHGLDSDKTHNIPVWASISYFRPLVEDNKILEFIDWLNSFRVTNPCCVSLVDYLSDVEMFQDFIAVTCRIINSAQDFVPERRCDWHTSPVVGGWFNWGVTATEGLPLCRHQLPDSLL